MGRTLDTREIRLLRRELLILLEIGKDRIDSASSFVDYMHGEYGFSKSSLWYNLNRLKEKGFLDFATRDNPGRVLKLSERGVGTLPVAEHERRELASMYSMATMVER